MEPGIEERTFAMPSILKHSPKAMKTTTGLSIIVASWLMVLDLSAQTNAPVIGPLAPVLSLLPSGISAFLMRAIAIFGSFSLILAPFSVWIQHRLTDMLNSVAASADPDDDVWLSSLFRNPAYRIAATALRFIQIRLPTIADLQRAISLQAEMQKPSTRSP